MTFREISRLPQFEKDFKKLLKRFKTLEDDLRVFIKTELVLYHKLKKDNRGIFPVKGLKIQEPKIFIAKKFACRSLKGKGVKSGIRLVYAFFEEQDKIELIEIYHKSVKKVEDKGRILEHFS